MITIILMSTMGGSRHISLSLYYKAALGQKRTLNGELSSDALLRQL